MSSSHTLIALGALLLLSTLLVGFNQRVALSAYDISTSKDDVAMIALGSSYIEYAQSLAFDSYSDTASVPPSAPYLFTAPGALGPEVSEDSLSAFNDVDDLHGFVTDRLGPDGKTYRVAFAVRYVNPDDVNSNPGTQTFAKRLDVKMWRMSAPHQRNERADTVRLNVIIGYFVFE